MSTDPAGAPRPRPPTAGEVCAVMRLSPPAAALLDPTMTPLAYVEALLGARLHVPAIEVVAHALPRRLGLWWALLCAHHATAKEALAPDQAHLLRLALRWLREPSEPVRAAAEVAAREAGAGTLGGMVGHAVAMHARSEGAVAVANAVKLATARAPPPAIAETQRAYAVLGLHARVPEAALAAARRASSPRCCI